MTFPATIDAANASRDLWDAVVVGAGPAGTVAARELSRNGMRVLLVDKAQFPRRKVCGCTLNSAALTALDRVGLGRVVAENHGVTLSAVRLASAGTIATIALPGGVALSRERFDLALLREAVASGVAFLSGVSARLGASERDWREVRLGPIATRARLVVAADGLASTIAASDGVRAVTKPRSRLGIGTIVPDAPRFYSDGTVYMAVGRGGYVGLVRLEDGQLDLAAAMDPAFLREHDGPGNAAIRILETSGFPAIPGLSNAPWRGTPPLTRRLARIGGNRWLAIGDAAGYVEPFTGEGMAWAISSALAVTPIAIRAVRASTWQPRFVQEWTSAHARTVRQNQGICRVSAWVLRSQTLSRLCVTALSLAPRLASPVVAARG